MSYDACLSVQQLIDALQALPDEQKTWKVGCLYDCGYAWTSIGSIAGPHCYFDKDEGVEHKFIRLLGDY